MPNKPSVDSEAYNVPAGWQRLTRRGRRCLGSLVGLASPTQNRHCAISPNPSLITIGENAHCGFCVVPSYKYGSGYHNPRHASGTSPNRLFLPRHRGDQKNTGQLPRRLLARVKGVPLFVPRQPELARVRGLRGGGEEGPESPRSIRRGALAAGGRALRRRGCGPLASARGPDGL
jgi:hypothetical protein